MHLRPRLALAALLVACGFAACSSESPAPEAQKPAPAAVAPEIRLPSRPLRLGRPPHIGKLVSQDYTPLARHLGRAIGHDVELVVTSSYDDAVARIVKGELDLALLTPFAYVAAKAQLPELHLLATTIGEGVQRYRGYIVASAQKPWRDLSELRGKRFAFVDPHSASGYLYPLATLADAGIDPAKDFAATSFAGSHDAVVKQILAGKVDAGAIASTTFQHLRAEDLESKLVILGKTEFIPFDGFVAHPSLPEPVRQSLKRTVLELNVRTEEGRKVLSGFSTTSGFLEADDTLFDGVRKVAARVGVR